MSYPDRIRAVNTARQEEYLPLILNQEYIGRIWRPNIERLQECGIHLQKTELNQLVWQVPADIAARNHLLAQAATMMAQSGYIRGWRNELFPLKKDFYSPVHALIERAAVPVLGITGYGVHLNAVTMRNHKPYMWIARRSKDKPVEPDKLDQIVAGGIPYGIGVFDNLIKESQEEAGISPEILKTARAVGIISYTEQTDNGIRADIIFNYDIELPSDFVPVNHDGEVSEFYCLPPEEVAELVSDSESFKANSALVIIDYLIRHGYITPDSPDYETICLGMKNLF